MASPLERAQKYIDDVLAINAKHGMRSVESKQAYDTAVANALKQITSIQRAQARAGRRKARPSTPQSTAADWTDGERRQRCR